MFDGIELKYRNQYDTAIVIVITYAYSNLNHPVGGTCKLEGSFVMYVRQRRAPFAFRLT
jgi:hypothetical protein